MIPRQLIRAGLLTASLLMLTVGSAIALTRVEAARAASDASDSSGPAQLQISCSSPSLGGALPAVVYLPSGYSRSGAPLPVIYFLHGLPTSEQAYTWNGFVAAALTASNQRAIVVAPQGVRGTREMSDREYLDWSATEDWPQAISHDLTACIDARFDTIASRRGRALIGLSAGGYGAFNIGLRNLRTFGAVESWSGYFIATDESGYHTLKFGSASVQQAATVPSGSALAQALRRYPTLIGFYVGRGDNRFAVANRTFDAALRRSGIAHVYRTYAGGHSQALWSSQAPTWLAIALDYLSSGRTVSPAG